MNTSSPTPLQLHPQQMIDSLVPLVDLAGETIMHIYQQADHGVEIKDDQSPLTQADLQANAILVDGLKKLWPSIPVLSEEGGDVFAEGEEPTYYWAVDPLDGTKEFIKRNGEFTVNVALIFNGDPVLGVVLAPALDKLYVGYSNENHAFENNDTSKNNSAYPIKNAMKREAGIWVNIEVSPFNKKKSQRPIRIASSRSHPSPELGNWLTQFTSYEAIEVGSSLKFCLLAEGLIDIYPRFGPTCIWDTAAGHAVVIGASGLVSDLENMRLRYCMPKNVLNPLFLASSIQPN
ncbi:3'(2'),5'-bisphosphate nucleotidase CysQ [Polynucleobacter alcilacus]|uniref:3'(2'),5'-bisphosphate nucleotidase CysQ n=1 Tax=Polynucleobacter alcilacus TaxID=1819739 RepID=UPI001C0BBC43|nr:3'(2'),5'-bisphosphate nucleotidase CysQ [Polynucleobacter alcilacus]